MSSKVASSARPIPLWDLLTNLKIIPQYDLSGHLRPALVALMKSKLNESELKICNDEVSSAMDKDFFFIGLHMHLAVGTKK